jgi:hypothetical protein
MQRAKALFEERKQAWVGAEWVALADGPADQLRPALRAAEARNGNWLNVTPRELDGFHLNTEEIRDALAVRYGREISERPDRCDGFSVGCAEPFSERHAQKCACGGLPTRRHDEIASCVGELLMEAGFRVTFTPVIREAQREGEVGNVGDLRVRGLFSPQRDAILDVKVLDCDAASYRAMPFAGELLRAEARKRRKHGDACRERRWDFAPFVVGLDGSLAPAAEDVVRRIVRRSAAKTGRAPAVIAGAVKAAIQMAVLRGASLCFRGARARIEGPRREVPAVGDEGGVVAAEAPADDGAWEG